jgi:hypothetical protein
MPYVAAIVFAFVSVSSFTSQAGTAQDTLAFVFRVNMRQAEEGDLKAQEYVAFAFLCDLLEKQLTPDQLAEAQRLSLEWDARLKADEKPATER